MGWGGVIGLIKKSLFPKKVEVPFRHLFGSNETITKNAHIEGIDLIFIDIGKSDM